MMVSREIARDLLPLYVAGEASGESRTAVEEWLAEDSELARLAGLLRQDGELAERAGVSAGSDHTALIATKALLRRRAWLLALALFFTGLPLSCSFDGSGFRFLMIREAPLLALASLAVALVLWVAFLSVARRMRVTGL